jgi:hypothetical protein
MQIKNPSRTYGICVICVIGVQKKELKWNTDNADYFGLHAWPHCVRPENKLHR